MLTKFLSIFQQYYAAHMITESALKLVLIIEIILKLKIYIIFLALTVQVLKQIKEFDRRG